MTSVYTAVWPGKPAGKPKDDGVMGQDEGRAQHGIITRGGVSTPSPPPPLRKTQRRRARIAKSKRYHYACPPSRAPSFLPLVLCLTFSQHGRRQRAQVIATTSCIAAPSRSHELFLHHCKHYSTPIPTSLEKKTRAQVQSCQVKLA